MDNYSIFWTYYIACFIYATLMSSKTWVSQGRSGGLGITPAMDSLVIVLLSWALAPVDLVIRVIRVFQMPRTQKMRALVVMKNWIYRRP